MKILLIGKTGQLGHALIEKLKENHHIVAPLRQEVDIIKLDSLYKTVQDNTFNLVINCAAYTDVNKVEADQVPAYDVNVRGTQNLSLFCKEFSLPLMHFSTDYVFDGTSSIPYTEESTPHPLNVYGKTKNEGEEILRGTLEKYFIFRSCWLYSNFRRNFLTFLLKANEEGRDLTIVNDQIGCPTPVSLVEQVVEIFLSKLEDGQSNLFGTYNVCTSGSASWYEFAMAIKELFNLQIKITPISTKEFNEKNNIKVQRPLYSVLSNQKVSKMLNLSLPHWKEALTYAKLKKS